MNARSLDWRVVRKGVAVARQVVIARMRGVSGEKIIAQNLLDGGILKGLGE